MGELIDPLDTPLPLARRELTEPPSLVPIKFPSPIFHAFVEFPLLFSFPSPVSLLSISPRPGTG